MKMQFKRKIGSQTGGTDELVYKSQRKPPKREINTNSLMIDDKEIDHEDNFRITVIDKDSEESAD